MFIAAKLVCSRLGSRFHQVVTHEIRRFNRRPRIELTLQAVPQYFTWAATFSQVLKEFT